MAKEIEEIICEILMEYGFDDNYIKYSSYKYKLFSECLSGIFDDYKSICKCMNLYFDGKEEEVLFEIINSMGYRIHQFNNYCFTKIK